VDPVPDPLLLRKSCSTGNWTRDFWICSQELWPLDHRGGHRRDYRYINVLLKMHHTEIFMLWALPSRGFIRTSVSKPDCPSVFRQELHPSFWWVDGNDLISVIETISSRRICHITSSPRHTKLTRSRDSVVGIATGYEMEGRGVGVRGLVWSRIFSSPRRPDWLFGPLSLLFNGYRRAFPRGWSGRAMKLSTHLQLVPMSRKCGSIHPLPHTPSWSSA
jgi:hypothetical protein